MSVQPYDNPPHGQQPYGQQPYGQQPYGQQPPVNQVVIVNQPGVQSGPTQRNWNHALCGCCEDPLDFTPFQSSCDTSTNECAFQFFCPMCHACRLIIKTEENVCIYCCVPGWQIALRTKIRAKGNIRGSICDDCCVLACCYQCAMCQMSREWEDIAYAQ